MANFWFALDVGAYDKKTAHLTLLEHGVYFALMRHYYSTQKPIPFDAARLQQVCRAHSVEELEALAFIMKSFFTLKADGYHNSRADEEILKAKQLSKLRAISAKRRWDNKRHAKSMQLHNSTDAKADTVTVTVTTTEPKSKAKAASAFLLPDWIPQKEWQDFEEMRRKVRKPMTDRARSEIVTELFKLRSLGHDPTAVIAQSIRNSWQDVYELKGQNGSNNQINRQSIQPKPHVTAQHARQASNILAVAAGLGGNGRSVTRSGSGGMGNQDHPDSSGHAARPESGGSAPLEGEVIRVQR